MDAGNGFEPTDKFLAFKKGAIIAHQRVSRASRISECQKSLQARDTLSWCRQKDSAYLSLQFTSQVEPNHSTTNCTVFDCAPPGLTT